MSLKGKIVVFTGTLTMKRDDATSKAEKAGATVTGSVSGKTNILVAGPGAGAKIAAAEAKGVTVWTEDEFLAALGGGKAKAPEPKKAAPKKAPAAKKAKVTGKKSSKPHSDDDEVSDDPNSGDDDEAPPPTTKAAKKEANTSASDGERRRPVDRLVPGRNDYTVFEDWSVTLNQTNIGGNNNKYYIIQLLQGKGGYHAWFRWGRVGEPGQNSLIAGGTLEGAKTLCRKKFRDKTQNDWDKRMSTFKPVSGKYTLVETEEKEGDDDASQPMGKLSKNQIEKGQAVLKKIGELLDKKASRSALVELSSTFFTLIPTNFGRRVPEPITTMEELNKKEELLKFYLRMGFEEVEDEADTGLTPIDGVLQLALPPTLQDACNGICDKSQVAQSVFKGSKLAETQAGSPLSKMDKELYGSIMLYTSNAIYAQLNKVLRDENRNAVKKYFKYLRIFFEATNRLPKNKVTLWRGISVDLSKQYTEGATITWWGVSSCTSDQNVARNFMKGCGGDCSLLTIETKNAVDISQVTFFSNEKESILMPGTQLKVKSCKKQSKIAEIHLEEVGCLVN